MQTRYLLPLSLLYLFFIILSSVNYFADIVLSAMVPASMLWLGLAFFLVKRKDHVEIPLNILSVSVFLFFLWLIISVFLSQVPEKSFYGFSKIGSLPLLFFMVLLAKPSKKYWLYFETILSILLVAYAIYNIYYYCFYNSFVQLILDKNINAVFFSLIVFLLMTRFLALDLKAYSKQVWFKALIGIGIFILCLAIAIINSRAALFGFLVAFAVLLFYVFKSVSRKDVVILCLIVILAFGFRYCLLPYIVSSLSLAATTSQLLTMASFAERLYIWQSAFKILHINPWYGSGLYTFPLIYPRFMSMAATAGSLYVHNDFLQFLIEIGYPGLILFVTVILAVAYCFINFLKKETSNIKRLEVIGIFSTFLAIIIYDFFNYIFYYLTAVLIIGFYLGYFHNLTAVHVRQKLLVIKQSWLLRILIILLIAIPFITCLRALGGDYFFRKAGIAFNQNKIELALQNFQMASNIYPTSETEFRKGLIYAILVSNMAIKKDQQYKMFFAYADNLLNRALVLNPYNCEAYNVLGLLYILGAKSNLATDSKIEYNLAKAVELNPLYAKTRLDYAKYLFVVGRRKKALQILNDLFKYQAVNKTMTGVEYQKLLRQIHPQS